MQERGGLLHLSSEGLGDMELPFPVTAYEYRCLQHTFAAEVASLERQQNGSTQQNGSIEGASKAVVRSGCCGRRPRVTSSKSSSSRRPVLALFA